MSGDFAATGQSGLGPLHPKPNSDWEKRRAARTVAHHATDAADCAELLEMLELTAKDGKMPEQTKAQQFNPYGGARRDT